MDIKEFSELGYKDYLIEAKRKCETDDIQEIINKKFDDKTFSNYLFKKDLFSSDNTDVYAVNLQSLYRCLCDILDPKVKPQIEVIWSDVYLEFAKYVHLFDRKTKLLNVYGGVTSNNLVVSMNFFNLALSSIYIYSGPNYQGHLPLVNVPIYLRLAIETHIKNTIGLIDATPKKGKSSNKIIINISLLLNFFNNKKYQKYLKLPVELFYLKDINYWANKYVHTGIPCSPWVSFSAINFLKPIFKIRDETAPYIGFNTNGYSYLNTNIPEQELKEDLEKFLSQKLKKEINLNLHPRGYRSVEGSFWYKTR